MTEKFHERFALPLDVGEAQHRFIVRIQNRLFPLRGAVPLAVRGGSGIEERPNEVVADALGEHYQEGAPVSSYIKNDFHCCLRAVEAFYAYENSTGFAKTRLIDKHVLQALADSELDLGIQWQNGLFIKTGAAILDRILVNDELSWLSSPQFKRVHDPFEKGLSHFLHAEKRPELLFDVITDMYEAVEALAKIVTGRDGKDLSANAESFISKMKASAKYKTILKDYIDYANDFRHSPKADQPRQPVQKHEVESFIYLTGLFIRFAQMAL